MKNKILLIQTGGTIDAAPYADPQRPPRITTTLKSNESLIPQTIRKLGYSDIMDIYKYTEKNKNISGKDSKLITKNDIQKLAHIIAKEDYSYFIITHGTDAMAKNAEMLQNQLQNNNKITVFVGAMIPLSMHTQYGSDATENISFTIENIIGQKSGVYMTGYDAEKKSASFYTPQLYEKNFAASKKNLKLIFEPKNKSD